MLTSSDINKTHVYRNELHQQVALLINDWLDLQEPEGRAEVLIEWAAEAMAMLIEMEEKDYEVEWVFKKCKDTTLSSLRQRESQLHSKLAAAGAEDIARVNN